MEFINPILEISLNFILFYMIFLLSTIIHEFGHALPALILTKENVKIILGKNTEKSKKISLSRLIIKFRAFNPFVGFTYWDESELTRFKKIVILAGGPIFSLVFAIVFLLVGRKIENKLLVEIVLLKKVINFAGVYLLYQFISTAIPIIYPKWWPGYSDYSSDGYQVLKLIKSNKAKSS